MRSIEDGGGFGGAGVGTGGRFGQPIAAQALAFGQRSEVFFLQLVTLGENPLPEE